MLDIWLVSLILLASIILLITEKLPVDLTAIIIMVALIVTGLLKPSEAVAGFANPAVITVAAMFMISRGMIRTGALGFIGHKLIEISRGKDRLALLLSLLIVAVASAFINNTPVVVLFIPIMLSISCEYGLSPSKFLIPISYASILAGTCTLIGTSTNIIVSDLSASSGYGPIGMFELARLGLPVALIGIALIYFLSPHLMPDHAAPTCDLKGGDARRYLTEFRIPEGSRLVGRNPEWFQEKFPSIELFEIVRAPLIHYPGDAQIVMGKGDLLLVKGSVNDLVGLLNDRMVELPYAGDVRGLGGGDEDHLVVELVLPPQSSLVGIRLLDSHLQGDSDVHILAIKSRMHHYDEAHIRQVRLRVGDIILVRCPRQKLEQLRAGGEFIVIEDVHHEIVHKRLAGRAMLIFAGVVAAATFGVADIMLCAMAGVVAMLLTRCLELQTAYRDLRADVLLLIVGTIALGAAMEKTGATHFYARTFLSWFNSDDPRLVLGGILLLTSISTQVLSNNATAVLLLPIAISTALSLGVSPKPFIMAVCFGASACFASPIGYQTNLMVYGPGSYRFSDYLKLGMPLNLLVIGVGVAMIPRIWPF
ncbi:MAG: SLC13 family permease [Desulfobacterales bacterium]